MASAPRRRAEERRSAPRRTVRGKLALLVAVPVVAAVALVSLLSAWWDAGRDAAAQAGRLHAVAAVAAAVSGPAVAGGDAAEGARVLRNLARTPGVVLAEIDRTDGSPWMRVSAPGRGSGRPVSAIVPLVHAGRPVGRIILSGRSEGMAERLTASLGIGLAATLLALGAGFAAAWRMQQDMVGPLVALTRSMADIQRERRFGSSVAAEGEGEIGDLVHGFNRMQAEIRDRDATMAGQLAVLEGEVAAAGRSRSDLLAAAGREIRAPMSGIAGMAERLAAGELAPGQRRLAEVIARSGASLLATMDDILDIAGAWTGEAEQTVGPVDLAEVVEDACLLFWDRASAKGLDLAAYVDPETPARVAADPVRLRQLVAILVNTAIRSTQSGGVLVEVEPDETFGVRISVHDTGAGIPAQEIGEVFAASSAGAGAAPKPGSAYGLGLAICKRAVEAMGGRFLVNSEVGRGSTFAFRLPLAIMEGPLEWPRARGPNARVHLAVQGLSSRRALSRYLAHGGFTVGAAADERTVLRIADAAFLRQAPVDEVPTIRLDAAHGSEGEDRSRAILAQPFRRADLAEMLWRFRAGEALDGGGATARGVSGALSAVATPIRGPAAPESQLIDPQVAAQLEAIAAGGRAEFVSRVYSLYRENAPDSVLKLMEAAARLDAAGCAKAAHALKSMSYNIGASAVAAQAGEIEAAARDGTPPAGMALAELQNLLAATLTRLNGGVEAHVRAEHTISIPGADAELLAEMEKGLAEDQMSLVYQPQVDRDGEKVVGVEALIRWTHPTRGPISPAVFIPVAERHGLIPRITNWVVERLLAETRYLTGVQIAFNVSAVEFSEPAFVDRLMGLVGRSGYDPRRLEVEITETAILQNETAVRGNIDRLRATGMKVALDDFGAGYSSLGHLRRYPFDKLKIDREFITDCSRDMQAATVVHAVVSIGRALGMKVIAEGVETDTQRKFLKVAGVHAMQGYLFGKPVSIDELAFALSHKTRRAQA